MEGAKDSARQYPSLPEAAPRVRLTVMRGPGEGASVELHRVVTLIGSREGCKVCLRHRGVAPVHCAIVNTGYEAFVRDLITEGKTYLNDLPVECERLGDGDVIRIAQWEFSVRIAAPAAGDASAPINLDPARTVALQAANNGRLIKLGREVAVIGRAPGCDVLVQHGSISRAHALIASHMGQPTVLDVLSTHGLVLNGQPVVCAPLQSGDVLDLGPTALRVVIPQGPARAAAQEPAEFDLDTTVIRLDDAEDKVDIRAAELDLDRKS